MFSGVNRKLATTAAERGGWFDREDILAAGYTDNDIRTRLRAGSWVRLYRASYAELPAGHEAWTEWERARWLHGRTAKAVYHRLGGRAVLSHQSALVLHGIEVSDLDLTQVHLTRRSGLGRSRGSVCQHAPRPPVPEPVEVEGIQLTAGSRAVVETIRHTPYPIAVSVVDEALRKGLATPPQLADVLGLFGGRSGIGTAIRAVQFGDGRAESVGESRLRVLLADLGLPTPVLQAEIRDGDGNLVGRVDFLLAEWSVIVEFDGALKYAGKSAWPLVEEKRREDRLRDLGYEVVRASWLDLTRPADLTRRIRAAMHRAAARPAH